MIYHPYCTLFLFSFSRIGVNDTVSTSGGHSLLHWAVMCGNNGAISVLAQVQGVDVNITNIAGETPLMLAVKVW